MDEICRWYFRHNALGVVSLGLAALGRGGVCVTAGGGGGGGCGGDSIRSISLFTTAIFCPFGVYSPASANRLNLQSHPREGGGGIMALALSIRGPQHMYLKMIPLCAEHFFF